LNAQVDVNLEIVDRRQLESILASIRKITGVYGVERVYQT
jgi:(p)ppGpp synthase/HD superfamily hydrolase